MSKGLPEGYYSDKKVIWLGAENKEDASVVVDLNTGNAYFGNIDVCIDTDKKKDE